MGFMGISHWVASDHASDFRAELQDCNGDEKKLKNCVAEELVNFANEYNTSGYLNIPLIIADEGNDFGSNEIIPEKDITPVISHLLTKEQYKYILGMLKKYIKNEYLDVDDLKALYDITDTKYKQYYPPKRKRVQNHV